MISYINIQHLILTEILSLKAQLPCFYKVKFGLWRTPFMGIIYVIPKEGKIRI